METYIASRMSEGNKTFPVKIIIDSGGITIKHPGLFSGNEETILFNRVASVKVESPVVGYSTIIIHTTGHGEITAHGFTKSEVTKMRKTILEKI